MKEFYVTISFKECKTIHCVGGWYFLACIKRKRLKQLIADGYLYWSYDTGADLMAEDLGFANEDKLTDWADENPDQWGNDLGRGMFSSSCAYNHPNNLDDIVAWFERIVPRLPA